MASVAAAGVFNALAFAGAETFTREPHISDYYKPTDEMEEYQHTVIALLGLGGEWGGYKLISSVL